MDRATSKKPVGKTILFGLATAALYGGVFSYADTIAHKFAMGGLWAAGPIATVFVFSYVHGAFAHNLWTCLGIEARQQRKDVRATRPAAQPQARATVNA